MKSRKEIVKEIIAQQLGFKVDSINDKDSLVGDLGADSLDEIEMLMDLEEEFELEISDIDGEKMRTVNDVCEYLDEAL